MSSYNPLFAQDQTAWLFEIGQKLRVGYDDIAEPVPPHLTALLKVLEIAATDQQTREDLLVGSATMRFEERAVCGRDVQTIPVLDLPRAVWESPEWFSRLKA
jgi:hypothetical protein